MNPNQLTPEESDLVFEIQKLHPKLEPFQVIGFAEHIQGVIESNFDSCTFVDALGIALSLLSDEVFTNE